MNDRWRRLSFGWCNRERRFTSLVRSTGLVVSARGAARSPRALCRGKKFVERWPKHASQCFRSMENWIEFSTSDDEIILRILDYLIASRDISVSPFLLFFFFSQLFTDGSRLVRDSALSAIFNSWNEERGIHWPRIWRESIRYREYVARPIEER